jgi:DnaK suppressor protein
MAQGKKSEAAKKGKKTAATTNPKKAASGAKGKKPAAAAKGKRPVAAAKAKKPEAAAKAKKPTATTAKAAKPKKVAAAAKGKGNGPAAKAKKPAAAPAKAKKQPARRAARLPHVDNRTLDQIITKLHEMRDESQHVVNTHVQADLQQREKGGDVGDDMDQASNERDREFSLLIHQRHLRRLKQIDEAFQRIDEGTYGLCEGTEEPINPKRLLIMPLARFTLEYQQQQEKMLGRSPEERSGGAEESMISDE